MLGEGSQMSKGFHTKDSLLKSLDRHIGRQITNTSSKNVRTFAKLYFSSVSQDELKKYSQDELFALAMEAWNFVRIRKSPRAQISFCNQLKHDSVISGTNIYILLNDVPFVIDSVRQSLSRSGANINYVNNSVLHVRRSVGKSQKRSTSAGRLIEVKKSKSTESKSEALVCIRCEHIGSSLQAVLEKDLRATLKLVMAAVKDFGKMHSVTEQVNDHLKSVLTAGKSSFSDLDESVKFLDWLLDNHFTFLGYEKYSVTQSRKGRALHLEEESLLGVSRYKEDLVRRILIDEIPKAARNLLLKKQICHFEKSTARSKVHRPAYCDYVIVKEFDDYGMVTTEHRFLGLYTSSVYYRAALDIPLVRNKVNWVLQESGYTVNGHSYKDLLQVINTLPRDELFQLSRKELLDTSVEITQIQETRTSKLFIRKDAYGQFFSCLVYVPRDIYDTKVRISIQEFLVDKLNADAAESETHFSESSFARVHYILRATEVHAIKISNNRLEQQMVQLIKPWADSFLETLQQSFSDIQAREIFQSYSGCFTTAYRENYGAEIAVDDVAHIQEVVSNKDLSLKIFPCDSEVGAEFRFKLFSFESQLFLSAVTPVLENMGLGIISEKAFKLVSNGDCTVWLHDFSLYRKNTAVDVSQTFQEKFEEAFRATWEGRIDDDVFNTLVAAADLNWRDAALLRAYAAYLKQIQFGYGASFIAETLAKHRSITRDLIKYFHKLFDPSAARISGAGIRAFKRKLQDSIDAVENLAEDGVLRVYSELINATLRTNFFQSSVDGAPKAYLSLKLEPRMISKIPAPKPAFEVFVYSREVEGVHLRFGKVARGGLRWSDRREDYRTEVLGLVKAQQVKNSVIVPVGAKGGFVMKQSRSDSSRDEFMRQGVECYKTFIRGLLDITDDVRNSKIVPPSDVICRDEQDPYLVVAADKGTATFSDIANDLATEYGFWLGDGFASGGSNGYDHKKMGITARGAWISVQRHFREIGIDVQAEDISVIGIGDMSGDVFGNGMLLSKHICLLAGFNHLHIFVDPTPDPARSFRERKRLFGLPRSSWSDYKKELISKGGGVFLRSSKSISISPEMKAVYSIEDDVLTPDQLISRLLKAPADLIWNGGIGTYGKSTLEIHAAAGDKANDGLRVNGAEMRARVIGEGGNLGFTQAARIEFGIHGGVSLTDFIDNSAGVDCSDHEVNIKILLNAVKIDHSLTDTQRNRLLESMEDDVAELVLRNNYSQVKCIGLAFEQARYRNREYADFINYLESTANLDRLLEGLPKEEEIEERYSKEEYLTRPEIAVMTSYMKMYLKSELESADYIDADQLLPFLYSAFPAKLRKKYSKHIQAHPLRKQIIATQLANSIVNDMGPSFVYRMSDSTGSTASEVVKAALLAREIFDVGVNFKLIDSLDFKIDAALQAEMYSDLMKLSRRTTRWLLRNRRGDLNFTEPGDTFIEEVEHACVLLARKLPRHLYQILMERKQALVARKVPEGLAHSVASSEFLIPVIGLVDISRLCKKPIADVMDIYYRLGDELQLAWLTHSINKLPVSNHWQALARVSYQDDVAWQRRTLTLNIAQGMSRRKSQDQTDHWLRENKDALQSTMSIMTQLQAEPRLDYSMFSVVLRELLNLAQKTSTKIRR